MKLMRFLAVPALALLSACAGLTTPSDGDIAALPVVTYPAAPPAGDYVYKLPAGKPIDMRILVDGSALTEKVDQTISATLRRDIYLHKQWASADGRTWHDADKVIGVNLTVSLPSYEKTGPGELHLTVNRRD